MAKTRKKDNEDEAKQDVPQVNKLDGYKKAVVEALWLTNGNITEAVKRAGISRTMHYNYLKSDPVYAEHVRDIEESLLDESEAELRKLIKAGNVIAILFHLKTKGKVRGYVERIESTGADGGPLKIEAADMDDRQLDNIINAIKGGK